MKTHSTNYFNSFIAIADDCPVDHGEIPPVKGDKKSVANMQYDLLIRNPYRYTSDDVFFQVYADRNDLTKDAYREAREHFFSKGQPCFRASPLTKRYGWGVHSDKEGKIALFGRETEAYERLSNDPDIKVYKAMKSSR